MYAIQSMQHKDSKPWFVANVQKEGDAVYFNFTANELTAYRTHDRKACAELCAELIAKSGVLGLAVVIVGVSPTVSLAVTKEPGMISSIGK